jgi:hypothetical protein
MQYSMFHKTKIEEVVRETLSVRRRGSVEKKTPVRRGAKESCERKCNSRVREWEASNLV